MAQYIVTGTITYTSRTNRDTALTNINNVLASYPTVVGYGSSAFPSGVNASGNTVLTVSLLVPDEATIEAFRMDLLSAWSSTARSTVNIGMTRDGV